jgi:hypothetical protein
VFVLVCVHYLSDVFLGLKITAIQRIDLSCSDKEGEMYSVAPILANTVIF